MVAARIVGHRLDFPRVVLRGGGDSQSWEFAWETIAHSLNTDNPLEV